MTQPKQSARKVKKLVLTAMCIGFFMVILDTSVVNVALKKIQENLNADVSGLQWVVDGYALVFASFQLTAGALGDRLGSKRVFLAGLLIFTIASALCSVAPTLWTLLAARAIQGFGAALIIPASLSLLSRTFSEPKELAKAIATWSAAGGVAISAGPVVGGFLVDSLGWRSIFFINLPVGVIGYTFAACFISESTRSQPRGLDLAGQVAGIAALSSLTFALIEGGAQGWTSPLAVSALGIFLVTATAFVALEHQGKNPILPLKLFTIPTVSAATLVGLLLNFGYYGVIFLLSLFFQKVRGYSPLVTGLAFMPMTVTPVLANYLTGWLTGHIGPRLPMAVGIAFCGSGLLALASIGATTSYTVIFTCLLAIGFGGGLAVPAMTAALLGAVPKKRSGIASGVFNTSRQVGGVIGVALLGSLVSQDYSFVNGMHLAVVIAGSSQLVGCMITLLYIRRGRVPPEAIEEAELESEI